jgi:rod shape-determining protein MreD
MIPARANRIQLAVVLLLLVALHFYVRPRLWGPRVSPDFLLVGLMLFAMRSGPGASAIAGFMVGLAADSLTPARFGAGALAHTVVAYVASWARAVFFADNLLVNAAFVAAGVWLLDPDRARGVQPAAGALVGPVRARDPAGVPRVVLDPARRMSSAA